MKWMKGMFLLLAANILIMVTLSLTVPLLINIVLPMFGIDLQGVGRPQLVSLGPRLRLWWRLYQFGLLQTNGSGHVGLPPDHPTPVACRTGHLRLRPGNRATAPHYDA